MLWGAAGPPFHHSAGVFTTKLKKKPHISPSAHCLSWDFETGADPVDSTCFARWSRRTGQCEGLTEPFSAPTYADQSVRRGV